jgi:hypothetical protein
MSLFVIARMQAKARETNAMRLHMADLLSGALPCEFSMWGPPDMRVVLGILPGWHTFTLVEPVMSMCGLVSFLDPKIGEGADRRGRQGHHGLRAGGEQGLHIAQNRWSTAPVCLSNS